jgi:MoaA/NifB/PqqE/SkfB family radical SAM enzyme
LAGVLTPANIRANLLVKLGEITSRTHALPLVVFAPTARCNSRCVSCDWWRADGAGDLSLREIAALAAELPRFGTRVVVFTGGEPLVRADVMAAADLFRAQGITLQLLTSGLALGRFADEIGARFQTVTVSLDGHTPELYRAIRGVDGLGAVVEGVRKLRARAPHVPVWARSTLHRHNFRFLPDLIAKSREIGLDQISFLAADVTAGSGAFNRRPGLTQVADEAGSPAGLLLTADEADEFEAVVEATIRTHARAFEEGRVAPAPDGLRRLVRYYRAHLGQGTFTAPSCNAPWASLFIEADGAVRPCFFHPPVGNLRERRLADLLSDAMPAFRAGLDVATNPTCARCVCSLKVGLRSKLW